MQHQCLIPVAGCNIKYFPAVDTSDDALLKQALEMSMQVDGDTPSAETTPAPAAPSRDISLMSEEEQIEIAMQMSLAASAAAGEESMDTDQAEASAKDDAKVRVYRDAIFPDFSGFPDFHKS